MFSHYRLEWHDGLLFLQGRALKVESSERPTFLLAAGRLAEAEAGELNNIQDCESSTTINNPDAASPYRRLSDILVAEGKMGLALAAAEHARTILERNQPPASLIIGIIDVRIGDIYEAVHLPKLAITAFERAEAYYAGKNWVANSWFYFRALRRLAVLYQVVGNKEGLERVQARIGDHK